MENDPLTITEERQNRRQFFNGLGKWSLAIIAAVTALRDSSHSVREADGSRLEAPSRGAPDARRQILAKKKRPHGDQPHLDAPHADGPAQPHQDYWRAID